MTRTQLWYGLFTVFYLIVFSLILALLIFLYQVRGVSILTHTLILLIGVILLSVLGGFLLACLMLLINRKMFSS